MIGFEAEEDKFGKLIVVVPVTQKKESDTVHQQACE